MKNLTVLVIFFCTTFYLKPDFSQLSRTPREIVSPNRNMQPAVITFREVATQEPLFDNPMDDQRARVQIAELRRAGHHVAADTAQQAIELTINFRQQTEQANQTIEEMLDFLRQGRELVGRLDQAMQ